MVTAQSLPQSHDSLVLHYQLIVVSGCSVKYLLSVQIIVHVMNGIIVS